MSQNTSVTLLESLTETLAGWGLGASAAWAARLALIAGVALLAAVAYVIAQRLVLRAVRSVARRTRARWDDVLVEQKVFQRLVHMVPALVLYSAMPVVFPEAEALRVFFLRVALAYMYLAGALAASALLSALVRIYESSFAAAREHPIRSYVQVVTIFLWIFVAILVVAALTDRRPGRSWAVSGR